MRSIRNYYKIFSVTVGNRCNSRANRFNNTLRGYSSNFGIAGCPFVTTATKFFSFSDFKFNDGAVDNSYFVVFIIFTTDCCGSFRNTFYNCISVNCSYFFVATLPIRRNLIRYFFCTANFNIYRRVTNVYCNGCTSMSNSCLTLSICGDYSGRVNRNTRAIARCPYSFRISGVSKLFADVKVDN